MLPDTLPSERVAAARHALDRLTELRSDGPWTIAPDATVRDVHDRVVAGNAYSWDLELIVAMTTPALLAALGGLLADAQSALAEIERDDSAALATIMQLTGGGRHRFALQIARAVLEAPGR